MRIIFSPLEGPATGKLLTHGGARWRCRKPVHKRAKSLAEVTDGRIIGTPWEQCGTFAHPVHLAKRDKMGPKERGLAENFAFKPSAKAVSARRHKLIDRVRASWKEPEMSKVETRERIETWKRKVHLQKK